MFLINAPRLPGLPRRWPARSNVFSTRKRRFGTSPSLGDYASTLPSLRLGAHTRMIFQGLTGQLASANAAESMAWGTKVVGGTKPGYRGTHQLGLPIFPTVREAVAQLHPDATGIYVPAARAPAAIEESIEAEVPLIVAVAEHIPLHAMLRIHSILKTQSASRLVGANSPGIISARARCRIGFQPLRCFEPGRIGIAAKSGTLSYEAVASTTRAGLGQSLCIGVGGDILPGTDLREALEVLAADEETEGIALIGEIGGTGELDAAEWIGEYHSRVNDPKPIVALVAGINAAPGRIMGHAGAFTILGEPSARTKIAALEAAGVTMVNHPEEFGEALKARLEARTGKRPSVAAGSSPFNPVGQRRAMHTAGRRVLASGSQSAMRQGQRRHLYISEIQAFNMLRERGFNAAEYSGRGTRKFLAVGVDRSSRMPCVIASLSTDADTMHQDAKRFPFDYRVGIDGLRVNRIAEHLRLGHGAVDSLRKVVRGLAALFYEKEAFLLETKIVERLGEVKIVNAYFGFDDAAFRTVGRQADIRDLRNLAAEDPVEVEAEKNGIVYIRLAGEGTIGTLVNGAGLAMNTIDGLADLGGRSANFLDTGGLATSQTVKKSFEAILRDPRVRVVFVNIFGGLTLGDMIARGILLAFKEVAVQVPVVVRIRGTNEGEAQELIAESGLPLYAFDCFRDAAAKAIELARR